MKLSDYHLPTPECPACGDTMNDSHSNYQPTWNDKHNNVVCWLCAVQSANSGADSTHVAKSH